MRKSPTSGCYADKARTGSSEDFGQEVLLGEVFQTPLVVRDQLPWPERPSEIGSAPLSSGNHSPQCTSGIVTRITRSLSLQYRYATKVFPIPFIGNIHFASCRFGILSGYRQLEAVCSRVVFQSAMARSSCSMEINHPRSCFETLIRST
jgi:hypothetical protein